MRSVHSPLTSLLPPTGTASIWLFDRAATLYPWSPPSAASSTPVPRLVWKEPRLTINRTNLGLFKISFQYILAGWVRWAKLYWKMILKNPRFVPFVANLTYFRHKSDLCVEAGMVGLAPKWVRLAPNWTSPGLFKIRFHCTEIWSEKAPDLSHLGPIGPTFEPNLPSTILTYHACAVQPLPECRQTWKPQCCRVGW